MSLIGQKFGKLTVIGYSGRNAHKEHMWLCACECGGNKSYTTGTLKRGRGKTCGCSGHGKSSETHGLTGTRVYRIWKKMKERCHQPSAMNFHKYGARGITVCEKWRHSFAAFFSDMGDVPAGMSIDRIDSAMGYSPDNCRWATSREQARNKRNNRWVEVNGNKMILTDAAALLGMNYRTVAKRCVDGVYKA